MGISIKNPGPILRGGLGAVGVLILWLTAAFAVAGSVPTSSPPEAVSEGEPLEVEATTTRIVEQAIDAPRRIRTCVVAPLPMESAVLAGRVLERDTGEVLWDQRGSDVLAPASVTKVFTAAAALTVLGPTHRLETQVVEGAQGELWLIGGGDPTITRSPGNNYYGSPHSLDQLASVVASAYPGAGGVIHLDDSRYDGFSPWDSTWRTNAWALGFVAPVSSIQVDGDRDTPWLRLGRRSTDPGARAVNWFAQSLSAHTGQVWSVGSSSVAPQGLVIAQIESDTVLSMVHTMLLDSDNTLAEVLAREVTLAVDAESINEGLHRALGLDMASSGLFIQDGSGLSPLTVASAESIVTLLNEIDSNEALSDIVGFLPIAGETGSLQKRFGQTGSRAKGHVMAKTGSIRGVRSLAGVIDAGERGELLFSVNISGSSVSDSDRDVIDRLVEEFYLCGENLANWSPPHTASSSPE